MGRAQQAAGAAEVGRLIRGPDLRAQMRLWGEARARGARKEGEGAAQKRPSRWRQRERDVERDEAKIERVPADTKRAAVQDGARRAAGQERDAASRHEGERPTVPQRERGDDRPAGGTERARDRTRITPALPDGDST